MFSMKLGYNRSCCELFRGIRRGISKTSTNNSYLLSTSQDNNIQYTNCEVNCHKNGKYRRWMREIQDNNNTRAFSSKHQTLVNPPLANPSEFREFMALFPDIVRELTAETSQNLPDVMDKHEKMLQYTTLTGKHVGGIMLVSSYKLLEDPQKLTPENIRLANILGWCVEMMLSLIIMHDDIIDYSEIRRGAPCWYLQPDVGLSAANDGLLLENSIYVLLRKYFRDHPAYAPMIELMHEVTYKTNVGQGLDIMSVGPDGRPQLELYTMDRYRKIADYKANYCFFQAPVAFAMYMVGLVDEKHHKEMEQILIKMGEFLQVQNDFFDCFADPALTGKTGTDIQVGKCTWLAVMTLQKTTPAQRKIMEEHYGSFEPESVAKIRSLYEELCIPEMFADYREETFNIMKTLIQQMSKKYQEVFFQIVRTLFKRDC